MPGLSASAMRCAPLGLAQWRPGRAASFPIVANISKPTTASWSAGFVARVPLDPRLTRSDLAAMAPAFVDATALVTPTYGRWRKRERWALRRPAKGREPRTHYYYWRRGRGLNYEDLLERGLRACPCRTADADESRQRSIFSGGHHRGPPKSRHGCGNRKLRGPSPATPSTVSTFGRDGRVPQCPPALGRSRRVILMSHLFAGATVVLRGLRSGAVLRRLVEDTGATRHVPAWCRRNLVRCLPHWHPMISGWARLAGDLTSAASRILFPPDVFARALGPRRGEDPACLLYGLTEAPVTCLHMAAGARPRRRAGQSDRDRLNPSPSGRVPAGLRGGGLAPFRIEADIRRPIGRESDPARC